MKTRFFPLFVVCGIVASSGLAARAIESNPTQPSDSAGAVPAGAAPQFSGRINDVVSLSKSGVDPSIVLAFIRNSPGPFEPSADEIIKLRDMGVSTPVLTAMLQRGAEVRDQAHAAAMAAAPDANTSPAQAPVITETPPNTPSDGSDNTAQPHRMSLMSVGTPPAMGIRILTRIIIADIMRARSFIRFPAGLVGSFSPTAVSSRTAGLSMMGSMFTMVFTYLPAGSTPE